VGVKKLVGAGGGGPGAGVTEINRFERRAVILALRSRSLVVGRGGHLQQ